MRPLFFCFFFIFTVQTNAYQVSRDSLPVSKQDSSQAQKKSFHWKTSEWIIPPLLIATGAVIACDKDFDDSFLNNQKIREERNKHFPTFSNSADNFLQYVPAVAVFALGVCGVKGKNDLPNQLAIIIKTEILMTAITTPLKIITAEPRPNSGTKNSFPSGHTAQAFAAATFLAKEYGHKSVWYSIGAYSLATGVGAMRILNDRHWLSDVVAGAGIGILTTNLVYATHKYKWGKKKNNQLTVTPTYGAGNTGVYMCYKF
jgi:membrane-associated phospholipid phosphatase